MVQVNDTVEYTGLATLFARIHGSINLKGTVLHVGNDQAVVTDQEVINNKYPISALREGLIVKDLDSGKLIWIADGDFEVC